MLTIPGRVSEPRELEEIMSRTPTIVRPTPHDELPDYIKDALAQENPSRFFTMNKQQVADYLKTKGVTTTRHKVTRAVYDGTLASKRDGKRRLISEYDALVWALSGREHFTRQEVSA